jgi:predicted protein tyrosine phosphatase
MKTTTNISRMYAQVLTKHNIVSPDQPTVLISINEPQSREGPARLMEDGWDDILRMAFWDITKRIADMRQEGQWLEPMNEDQAKEIADFIRKHWDKNIIVHCHAGISRSAAVVRILVNLGWTYKRYPTGHGLDGYNVHIYSLLKKQFSELMPIGS